MYSICSDEPSPQLGQKPLRGPSLGKMSRVELPDMHTGGEAAMDKAGLDMSLRSVKHFFFPVTGEDG
jgi:hypothetical protein